MFLLLLMKLRNLLVHLPVHLSHNLLLSLLELVCLNLIANKLQVLIIALLIRTGPHLLMLDMYNLLSLSIFSSFL